MQWTPDGNRCSHRPHYKMIPFGDTYNHHPLPPNPLHNTSSHAPNVRCCLHVFCVLEEARSSAWWATALSLSIPMRQECNGTSALSSMTITRFRAWCLLWWWLFRQLHTVCSSNVSEIVVMLSIARMAICISFIIGDGIGRNGVLCIVLDCNWFIGDLIDKVGDSDR